MKNTMKNKIKKLKNKFLTAYYRTMYKIGGRTYSITYSAESNAFSPKEYKIFRPFGKFDYKERGGQGITCYVPAVDDIRRFRLDRINKFELV
jgi:hypothetical protein